MKLNIFPNIESFIEIIGNNDEFKQQLDLLLYNSFPDEFNLSSSDDQPPKTLIEQIKFLFQNNRIENESLITFVAVSEIKISENKVSEIKIWGFAQLLKEKQDLRLINFCRDKTNYKKLGAGMLTEIYKFIKSKNINKLYLTVEADNKSLQSYYESLGWSNTGLSDMRGTKPGLEFVINL